MISLKHLTDIKALSKSDIENLFETATTLSHTSIKDSRQWHLGRSAMALFFENSTRTLTSFQLACQRLGVDCTALNIAQSSTQKGESIKDTVVTLNAMKPDLFIVRHEMTHIHEQIINWTNDTTGIINAGDGINQHPTQGLLDLYTISQHKKDFSQLKVAIIGDIKHSRVANSLIDGLQIMGTEDVRLYAPDALIPANHAGLKAKSMQDAMTDCDVVVMLRIQKERISQNIDINFDDWHQHYGLNTDNLKLAKAEAIVMHPGPMNRGIEISDEVADGKQSVVLEQVRNGVLMRQALMHHLLIQT